MAGKRFQRRSKSRQRVEACAAFLGLHPAIVPGALQHAKKLGYQALNDCKVVVRADMSEMK